MKEIYNAIGFNIISLAITLVIVWICGCEMTKDEQVKMIIGEVIFMALLTVGVMLMMFDLMRSFYYGLHEDYNGKVL